MPVNMHSAPTHVGAPQCCYEMRYVNWLDACLHRVGGSHECKRPMTIGAGREQVARMHQKARGVGGTKGRRAGRHANAKGLQGGGGEDDMPHKMQDCECKMLRE